MLDLTCVLKEQTSRVTALTGDGKLLLKEVEFSKNIYYKLFKAKPVTVLHRLNDYSQLPFVYSSVHFKFVC